MKLFITIQNPYTGKPALVEAEGNDYREAREQLSWLLSSLAGQPEHPGRPPNDPAQA